MTLIKRRRDRKWRLLSHCPDAVVRTAIKTVTAGSADRGSRDDDVTQCHVARPKTSLLTCKRSGYKAEPRMTALSRPTLSVGDLPFCLSSSVLYVKNVRTHVGHADSYFVLSSFFAPLLLRP